MVLRRLFIVFSIVAVASLLVGGGHSLAGQSVAGVSLEGIFTVLWGDRASTSNGSTSEYFLTTGQKETVRLLVSEELMARQGGAISLNQKQVLVQGTWLDGQQTLQVQSISLANGAKSGVEGVYGPQPWVSILCKFSGDPGEPRNKDYFTNMYSSQYPGLDNFWRQNSFNLANLAGSGVSGWHVLPFTRDHYLPGGNLDFGAAATDCTAAADPYVDFSPYVGINLMFNANLDGYAWGGGWYLCLDQVCKLWRMTWEPPWGYESIGVIAHETGHGFGLPHSEGNCQGVYDNRWDVMSDVWSNGSDPVYGTMGQHTISYHKEYLGWLTPGQVFSATSGTLATITLEKLALPQTNNFLEAVIPINGSLSHFYTLEVRQPTADPIDYDKWLPGFAVIIHEVTEGQSEPAILVDQDGDCNTGDAGAMFTVGEVFTDILHGITVKIESATPSGYVVTINNRFKPLQGVTIGGLDQGNIGESLPFTATVSPVDASTPITYTWEASSQTPVQHVGGAIDPVSFTWDEVGTKAITVTASNAGGEVVNTHFVTIEDGSSLAGVEISGPGVGYVHDSYTFTAYIQPISISLPITYTWSIDADTPITHSAGISDTLSFSWDEPGMHAIHVTASNPLSSVTDTWEVVIYGKVFLALCTKG